MPNCKSEVDTTAAQTISVLKRHRQDWLDDNDFEMRGLLAEEFAECKNWPVDKQADSLWDKFHHLRRKVQKRLHSMKDEWWKKKAQKVQDYTG